MHSDPMLSDSAFQTKVYPEDRVVPPSVLASSTADLTQAEHSSRTLKPNNLNGSDENQGDELVLSFAAISQKDGNARRFRADDDSLSALELASSMGDGRGARNNTSFDQFLETFRIDDLAPETRAPLEKIWNIEKSWRGAVRWVTMDSLLQKVGYLIGVRTENVLMPNNPEDTKCASPLWLSGGSIPLLSQTNRRLVHFIDGLREGTEFVIFRGIHLGITALAVYQLYNWFYQPTFLICHSDTDTQRNLFGLFKFYKSSDDNVLLSVFHEALTPSSPALSYLKYVLLAPFVFGLSKGVWNTRNKMIPNKVSVASAAVIESLQQKISSVFYDEVNRLQSLSEPLPEIQSEILQGISPAFYQDLRRSLWIEETLKEIKDVEPSFYNDLIRWFLPLPPIDQVTGNIMKNVLWNGHLSSEDLHHIFDIFAALATSSRLYTSVYSLGSLAPIVYALSLNDLSHLSQRKIQPKKEIIEQLLPDEKVEQAAPLLEEDQRHEGQRELEQEFANSIQERLKLKAKALALIEEMASFHDKNENRKSITNTAIALYAQYLLWSLGASRSYPEAVSQFLFKGGKLYVQIKFLQTVINALLKAEQCPRQPGVTLAGVQPWAQDLTQKCFDAYVKLFNVIPGQSTETLVGNLDQYYFPDCSISLDLSNKALDWRAIYNITKALFDHNIAVRSLNLAGNELGTAEFSRDIFATLSTLDSLDLSNNNIGFNDNVDASGTVALGKGIGALKALTSLNFSRNLIGRYDAYSTAGTVALGKGIGALRNLMFLDLSNNKIGSRDNFNISGTVALGKGISALKSLVFLNFTQNSIGRYDGFDTSGTVALAEGIQSIETLVSLDLSNNKIGHSDTTDPCLFFNTAGVKALGHGLSALSMLNYLDLSGNGISSGDICNASGTVALAKGIESLKALTFLGLSNNFVGGDILYPTGTVALGEGIGKLRNLTTLDFSDNSIGLNDSPYDPDSILGTVALAKGIGHLRALTFLNLSQNWIGYHNSSEIYSFISSIGNLFKLKSLSFIPQQSLVASEALQKLDEVLKHMDVPDFVRLISSTDVQSYCERLPIFVQTVNLSGALSFVEDLAIQDLMMCLKNRTMLSSLDISFNNIGSDVAATMALGKGISSLKFLTFLDLSNNGIGGEDNFNTSGTVALSEGISRLSTLTSLNLSENYIGSEDMLNTAGTVSLGNGIGQLSALTFLDLSGNVIGSYDTFNPAGTVALGNGIGKLSALTFLDLSGNQIGFADFLHNTGTVALGNGIGKLSALTFLDLSGNQIGGDSGNANGTVALGNGIGALKTLKSLNLSGNIIGNGDSFNPSGTVALGNGIAALKSLISLDLAGNQIGSSDLLHTAGTVALGNGLRTLKRLTKLDLSGNEIGICDDTNCNGTISIAEGIGLLEVLQDLNLARNNLYWTPSIVALANTLNSTGSIRTLNLGGNLIGSQGDEGSAALISVLPNLPDLDLSRLDLSGMTNVSWTLFVTDLQKLRSQELITACQNSRCFGGEVEFSSRNSGGTPFHMHALAAESDTASSFQARQAIDSEPGYPLQIMTSGASSPSSFLRKTAGSLFSAYHSLWNIANHPDVQTMGYVIVGTKLMTVAVAQTLSLVAMYAAIAP